MLRDQYVSSAVEHYENLLPYRDDIIGIGLDSLETNRPPLLFEEVFSRARKDGFRITCHCDIGQEHTHSNILEVLEQVGGGLGADRCDHGISATRSQVLMKKLATRQIGMTLCPWCYFRYSGLTPDRDIPAQIRTLYDAGIKITINSDDPAYMEDIWIEQNLNFVRLRCGFKDEDIKQVLLNAVDICWAPESVKSSLRKEIEMFQ